jgi:hypothetical protein
LANPGTAANWGVGATGSAVPANAVYLGIVSGGNLTGWTGAVTNAGTFAVQATLQASATTAIGKVDPNTLGNWGLQVSTQNSATPTNGALGLAQFNTTPTTISSGNVSPLQVDANGNLLVNIKAGGGSGGTSSSFGSAFPSTGTAIGLTNGTNMVAWSATSNYGTAPSAIAVPAVNASVTASALPTGAATSALQGTNTATTAHTCSVAGFSELGCLGQIDDDIKGSIPAGTNVIGKTGIDQTTFGTTNGVVSAANFYQAVAASQTATVLQSSAGATGDYLSHCIIYPTSTSPGVVTVFDNTNTAANSAILFPGGASSTSNLVPIVVAVGAKSASGPWKATTGANVSIVCVGKFS